ncbi:hypothetical protein GCM10010315_44430 [Streptomyces luteosporeus]|uniref:Fibronectin type-III domain-containing protein n=1 Tax=Streptomyces luteosporeus TaxID=173856 RepID=A0ABN3TZB7_9ACTN
MKIRGRLTYREGERGALQVTADVTFVYPVTRADTGGDDEIVRTIVRRELVLSWDDPSKVSTKPGTFSIVSYKYDMTNGGCGAPAGYFTPPFGSDRRADGAGKEVDPYDRSTPVGRGEPSGESLSRATLRSGWTITSVASTTAPVVPVVGSARPTVTVEEEAGVAVSTIAVAAATAAAAGTRRRRERRESIKECLSGERVPGLRGRGRC